MRDDLLLRLPNNATLDGRERRNDLVSLGDGLHDGLDGALCWRGWAVWCRRYRIGVGSMAR